MNNKKLKYKIGDKVRLKPPSETWIDFTIRCWEQLPDHVATIKKLDNDPFSKYDYYLEEIDWGWKEEEIDCLIERKSEEKILDPVLSRFELLDIR